ncbi:hypothetical protein FB567DRAFT_627288 [Paraphoma chrysanthemicola]|uniref:Uncharacterized protein n=1 Tax=Paraphoma chrysanthemicola TaxID=798071 RepID=A0A8K0R6C1_9PLEO|nr:hypothetical protein FB567DRAFT_627288 [Paraphoma chrysanthemicola]
MPAQRGPKDNNTASNQEHIRNSAPHVVLRGTPEYISVIKPEARRDIEDFVLDNTGELGVDKIGHEITNPTGTKFVFYLCLDEENDDEGEGITMEMEGDIGAYIEEQASDANGQVDSGDALNTTFINETTTTKTSDPSLDTASRNEAARKARLMRSHMGVSLASLIAAADSDTPPMVDAVDDRDIKTSPTTPEYSPLAVSPRTSPDDDTSPEVARASLLPRSKGSTSLAALIAAASNSPDHFPSSPSDDPDSDSESDTDISSETNTPSSLHKTTTSRRRPCYDPTFPGHAPCATHRMRIFGRSHIAATQLLRDQFETKFAATGYVGWYRAWVEVKREMMEQGFNGKMVMVHGGSGLRFEIGVEDEEEEDVLDDGAVNAEEELEVMWDEVDGCDSRSESLPECEMLDSISSFEEDVDCPGASEMGDDPDAGADGDDAGVGFEDGFVRRSSSPFDETIGLFEETTEPGERLDEDGAGVGDTERNDAKASENAEGKGVMTEPPTPSRIVHMNNISAQDTMSDKTSTRTSVFSRASGTTKSSRESRSTEDLVCSQLVDALHVINCMVEGEKRSVVQLVTRAISSASSHDNLFEDFDFDFEATQPGHKTLFDHIDDGFQDNGYRRPNVVAHDERVFDDFAAPYEDGDITIHLYGPEYVPSRRFRWARKMAEQVKKVSQKMKKAKRGFVKSSEQFTHTLAGFIPAALTGRDPFGCA